MNDLDNYRAAQAAIKAHAEDAVLHAAQRADELLEQGDMVRALTNIVLSVLLCLLAVWFGVLLGRQL